MYSRGAQPLTTYMKRVGGDVYLSVSGVYNTEPRHNYENI